jgi:threonine/homoserine/homoserine lactone efflux protein
MKRDLRKYSQQTIIRMVIWGILLIFIIGNLMIYIFFGQPAFLTGITCMLAGLLPLGAIYLVFLGLDYFLKKYNQKQSSNDLSSTLSNSEQSDKDSDRRQG